MNDLNKSLLLAVCVLFFSTIFFFFKFAAERAYAEDLKAQKEAAYVDARRSIKMEESARERAEMAEKAAQRANAKAHENFTDASIKRAELERLEAESARGQVEADTRWEARLERETAARQAAEKELEKANQSMRALESDILYLAADFDNYKAEAQGKIQEQEYGKSQEIAKLNSDIKKYIEEISKAKNELQELKKENEALKRAQKF
ncbi:MAG: hypothetical protein J6T16_08075 [Opitutales bacterium]|nr:hypothetical protein [Opitutales bacterium]